MPQESGSSWQCSVCVSVSYSGVEGQCDVLVVATGGEGDLRQSEVILGA